MSLFLNYDLSDPVRTYLLLTGFQLFLQYILSVFLLLEKRKDVSTIWTNNGKQRKGKCCHEKKIPASESETLFLPLYDFSGPHIPGFKISTEIFKVWLNSKKMKIKSHRRRAFLRQSMIKIISHWAIRRRMKTLYY